MPKSVRKTISAICIALCVAFGVLSVLTAGAALIKMFTSLYRPGTTVDSIFGFCTCLFCGTIACLFFLAARKVMEEKTMPALKYNSWQISLAVIVLLFAIGFGWQVTSPNVLL
jgi:divalent metal cation (Fe/Co/Zn/Cd) transporter